MNYIRQIWYEMRQQPLVTWVTIGGTALSIFLVMAFYMTSQVDTVETAPESARSRILVNKYVHVSKGEQSESSGSMSYNTARRLNENIDGIEKISYFHSWSDYNDVSAEGESEVSLMTKNVDGAFWDIFDFQFTEGRPFTQNEAAAGMKKAVITDKAARKLAGNRSLSGKMITVNQIPVEITGVVKAGSPLLKESFADLYMAWDATGNMNKKDEFMGNTGVYLLMDRNAKPENIKKEVERRYKEWNSQIKKDSMELIYHQSPFVSEEVANSRGSNNDPDAESPRKKCYLVYLILLLLPAINLSGMTRSRLRQRVSEIGVRRAFGASKTKIIGQLLGENLLISLIGGIIGLGLSLAFILLFSSLFIDYFGFFSMLEGDDLNSTPTFGMLFKWNTFLFTLLFCFVLNLLSTGIPAWKASRENPAEAIKS